MVSERKNRSNWGSCGHKIYDFRSQLQHIWLFVRGIFQEQISFYQVSNSSGTHRILISVTSGYNERGHENTRVRSLRYLACWSVRLSSTSVNLISIWKKNSVVVLSLVHKFSSRILPCLNWGNCTQNLRIFRDV